MFHLGATWCLYWATLIKLPDDLARSTVCCRSDFKHVRYKVEGCLSCLAELQLGLGVDQPENDVNKTLSATIYHTTHIPHRLLPPSRP